MRAASVRTHAHPDGPTPLFEGNDRPVDPGVATRRPRRPDPMQRANAVRSGPIPSCSPRRQHCASMSGPLGGPDRQILFHRHGIMLSERTIRSQLRRRGLHREALAAEPVAFRRYEVDRPDERWITDVLVGPLVPFPKTATR